MSTAGKNTSKVIPKYVQRRVQYSLTYLFILLVFLTFCVGLYKSGVHLAQLKPEEVTIRELPWALLLSLLRMTASYLASLVFAFGLGLVAARSELGERIIIPLLDILQSVPVVAFFPAAISIFIGISGGHRLGIELAATFLIFTSQAWNMAFAVYESTKTIPQDNLDAVLSYGVKGSQRFWKLYAPASVPRLVYNSILSWSNGWFFLVACEIIAVGQVHYSLPGIGSFLARAAEQDRLDYVLWGLVALTGLILSLDLLIWRPASRWADRFRQEFSSPAESPVSIAQWRVPQALANVAPVGAAFRTMWAALSFPFFWTLREVVLPLVWDLPAALGRALWRNLHARGGARAIQLWNDRLKKAKWFRFVLLWIVGMAFGVWSARTLFVWLRPPYPVFVKDIPLAILYSTGRLVLSLLISLAWILPVVLWSWNRPKWRARFTTLAQVGASLPAIALFPLIILVLVNRFGGGMEEASIILLMSGMQWYVLFNGLGGAAIIPSDLAEAIKSMGLSRWQVYKRLVLPAIRPALITGAITAWGGGWNALVVSEYIPYKGDVLMVKGLGALLNQAVYKTGDAREITICIAAMVGWIILINSLVWRPLYKSAADRYKFDA